MRMLGKFSKKENVRYISHLDMMRTMQRVFRRANIPVRYSQGFNPHPILSFASALSVGFESEAEWFDLGLTQDMSEEEFYQLVAPEMPMHMELFEVHSVEENYPALMSITQQATYQIMMSFSSGQNIEELQAQTAEMLQKPMLVQKKKKSKNKRMPPKIEEVDIAPLVREAKLQAENENQAMLEVVCTHAQSGSLNPRAFMEFWSKNTDANIIKMLICKTDMKSEKNGELIELYQFQ